MTLLLLGLAAGAAAASPAPSPGRSHKPKPTTTQPAIPAPTGNSIGARAVAIALRYLGVKYVWGGATPKGFDCSGLVMYVYAKLGIQLPHYTGDQWTSGYRVGRSDLRPGDLVFFYGAQDPQHVGLYVGADKFIHAPHTGDVVKISSLRDSGYAKAYVGAVRPYGTGPPIVFPVAGSAQYTNSFRSTPKGLLPGNDIIAPRKTPLVAVENGKVRIYTGSKAGGCMLYLYGTTGRTYEYLHLNNDVGTGNDNEGRCKDTAYAPKLKTGQKVKAGQVIGFLGDSGLADGTQPHVHFEVHKGGKPVNPYPYLTKARRLLFAVLPGPNFTVALDGQVVTRTDSTLTVAVKTVRSWPGGLRFNVHRTVTVDVPETATVQAGGPDLASRHIASLDVASKGQPVAVKTPPAPPTLSALLGKKGALSASEILLSTAP